MHVSGPTAGKRVALRHADAQYGCWSPPCVRAQASRAASVTGLAAPQYCPTAKHAPKATDVHVRAPHGGKLARAHVICAVRAKPRADARSAMIGAVGRATPPWSRTDTRCVPSLRRCVPTMCRRRCACRTDCRSPRRCSARRRYMVPHPGQAVHCAAPTDVVLRSRSQMSAADGTR